MTVLYEDNHLLVVNKPAGILAQADSTGRPDLLTESKEYVRHRFNKPGQVFLGLVHRLDREVSGVMVFARTSKSARRLSDQFRQRTPDKVYLAFVEGRIMDAQTLSHHVKKEARRSRVVKSNASGGKSAKLSLSPVMMHGRNTLLEVRLKTGRAQQIRTQLAHIGHPIVGDVRYRAQTRLKFWRNRAARCISQPRSPDDRRAAVVGCSRSKQLAG